MRRIALIACVASLALGPSAAAQAPDDPAYIVELEAERARLVAALALTRTHFESLAQVETALAEASRPMASALITPGELKRWAASCGVSTEGVPAVPDYEPVQTRRWDLKVVGPMKGIVCLALQLAGDGRTFAIDSLKVEPSGAGGARGHLVGTEWTLVYQRPPPSTPADSTPAEPALPITAGPHGRALAGEVAQLRRSHVRMGAGVLARLEWTRDRLDAIERVRARLDRSAWHIAALEAVSGITPLDGRLSLTPGRGELAGELLSDADRAPAEAVETPPAAEWDASGLKPARQVDPPLPVVVARGAGEPLLHLDALDAPAEALAVLLGGRLLTTRATKLRSAGLRFTGRMDAGRAADALVALRAALPRLASLDLAPGDGTGRPVSVRLVDGDSRDLDRLVAQVSGAPFAGCGVGVRVTVGVRDVPVDALAAALSAHYVHNPRCAEAPAATGSAPSAAPESPQPGWRLVATLRDGTTRRAIFEAADGALHVFSDRGAWDDVFLRFGRGRVVLPGPTVHVLEPARLR